MRLIDADALINEFLSLCGPQTGDGWDNWGVRNLIDRQKAVDAIPVEFVRDMMLEGNPDESKAAWRVMKAWEEGKKYG